MVQKTEILAKKVIFSDFFGQNFQKKEIIKKSEKTFPRYTYLNGFCKFLVIFVRKYIFLPLFKKIWGQKITFLAISQNNIFSQKSVYSNRFLVKFPF